jgi:hypothetical protein
MAVVPDGGSASPSAEQRARSLVLLSATVMVLQRRKAAGTLLPDACHAHQEAWFAALKQHSVELHDTSRAEAVEEGAALAPFVGYETYIFAASIAAYLLHPAQYFPSMGPQFAAMCAFVASALELFIQPRAARTAGLAWLHPEPAGASHARAGPSVARVS